MYVRTTEAKRRLTIELRIDQYDFLRNQAAKQGTTVSGLIRELIDECRSRLPEKARKDYKSDAFYNRRGSFDGPIDLAEHHDRYLYGEDS